VAWRDRVLLNTLNKLSSVAALLTAQSVKIEWRVLVMSDDENNEESPDEEEKQVQAAVKEKRLLQTATVGKERFIFPFFFLCSWL
jgi:hypothetical protein